MKRRKSGFTLIELLVVIAIIGIMSSVVLANLNGSRAKARDTKRIADIKQIQLALTLYFDVNHVYPGTLSTGATELAPNYIPTIPTPPGGAGGPTYVYVPLNVNGGACNGYHLGAALEQSTNSVLASDVDAVSGANPLALTGCGGAQTSSGDFYGISQACGSNQGTTDQCYDVIP